MNRRLTWVLVVLACSSCQPGWLEPLPASEAIAPEPQREGDAARGYQALLTGDYVSIGVPWVGHLAGMTKLEARDTLPDRGEKYDRVPYAYTVSTNSRGIEIVAPNCLACHASHLRGQLVVGLGNPDPVENLPSGSPTNAVGSSDSMADNSAMPNVSHLALPAQS